MRPTTDSTECISVATATAPQGPFVDRSSGPIICQTGLGGSIDPAPFLSAAGSPYLVWKSNGGSGQPATIWAQPLNASGTSLEPGTTPVALLRPTQAWESGGGRGAVHVGANGTYYLFYSGNNWDSGNYAEGVATCSGPLGPCGKPLGGRHPRLPVQPFGPRRWLRCSSTRTAIPGSPSTPGSRGGRLPQRPAAVPPPPEHLGGIPGGRAQLSRQSRRTSTVVAPLVATTTG